MNTNGLTIYGGPSVTTTGINAGNTAITNVASGLSSDSNAATVGDVKSLVNGLGSNSFKLTADSTSTATQALNKSGGLSFKVAGDSDLISTSATGDTVKVSISKGSLTNNTDGTVNANKAGVATTGDVATAVNDAVAKATGAQGLTITDGTHNGKINLKTQSLAITGTNGVDATVNNQNLTVGLNTATKTAIDNAQTAVNRTISLGANIGTTSSQSLKDGNVAFNVKGKTGDYITTAMNGSTVEISTTRSTINSNATTGVASVTGADGLVTAKNVSDAINKAAEAAKSGAAWNLTTNSSASNKTLVQGGDTVDLVNGDNIEISQDGTNKKKVTIKTKKDLMVDSIVANKSVTVGSGTNQISLDGTTGAVSGNTFAGNSFTAGNSVLNTTGFHITGGPSVTTAGIDAGNKAITNVASGLGDDSNAATVGDVKGLVDGVGKNTFTLTADTTSTTAQALNKSSGLSFKVAGDGNLVSTSATGDTVTVSVSQGSLTNNTDGTVNANKAGVATTGDVATAVNDAVAKATGSQGLTITDGANTGKVNLKTQSLNITGTNGVEATVNNQTVTVGLNTATKTAIDNAQTAVNRTISLGADSGTVSSQSLKDGNVAFNVKGKTGDYITTAMNGNTVEVSTQQATLSNNATTGAATVTGSDGLVTAKNVADTINAVADKIKTGAAWKLTTNSSATDATDVKSGDTVDLVNGDNIEISQDGTNKKKVTIKTKKDLTVDSIVANKSVTVGSGANQISLDGTTGAISGNTFAGNSFTAGNSVLNTTGFHITGGPSVTTAGIDAGNKAITNVASGLGNDSNAATVGDVKGLVDGVGKNTFTLTADTTSTTAQALNKSGGLSFKVAGDGNLVSTSATGSTVTVSVSQGSLTNNTDGTVNANKAGVATTGDVATAVNTAVAKATGAQALTITDGTTDGTINLKNEKLNVAGANGVTATVNNQTITVGLNTATKTAIDNAQTAVNRTISLGADSGTASSQSLKDGNVAFNVKGKTGDYITTAMNGSTVEISTTRATINSNAATGAASVTGADGLVTAKNVSDAINKAAEAAKSGAAWNLTTNSSITDTTLVQGGDTVDLVNGDNIEISQDGTNKKKVTIKTKKDLTVDSIVVNKSVAVGSGANQISLNGTNGAIQGNTFAGNSFTAGNSVLNTTGFHITGGPSVTAAGIDAGNKAITNVASGGTTRSNAATVGDVQDAVANLSQNLNITDGTNNGTVNLKTQKLNVVGANGVTATVNNQTITVGLDTNVVNATTKGIGLTGDTGATGNKYLKDGDVSFAIMGDGKLVTTSATATGVKVAVNTATITAGADGTITGPITDGVATAKNVADAINAATAKAVSQSAWKLAADGTTGTETISGGDTVNFKAGTNMEVSRTGKDITYKTKEDVTFKTVTAGTGANEVKLDGNTGTVTAKDITATGDVTAKNVTTSGNVTAAGTVKGDTVQGNTVKAGNVTITGGTTNTITGLSNTTWTPTGGVQANRAATEGQLQQAINQVNNAVGNIALTFKGDSNPAQSMTLQGNTFAITGDTMIKTTTNANGIGLSLDTSKVTVAYTANGTNGQTTSLASGFNFTDGNHTKATVGASGVVKYDAKTSTISVANGHASASGNDLATADNVADAINQMTQANAGNTTQLRQEISKVATETQRVGAHAAAMAALKPIQYDPLEPTEFMAGVGNYRGQTAAAIGLAHYTNDNTMFNVGVSVGGNHNMVNAGVTHKFGISAEKKNIPDRYKAGPISSIYVMQDEMTQLRSENEAYKAKLDKQQSEIDALKAAVNQLLASKA